MKTSIQTRVRNLLSTLGKRRALLVIAGVLVAISLVILSMQIGKHVISPDKPGPTAAAPSTEPAPPPGFVEFREPRVGFALNYPQDWARVQSADPQVVLVALKGTEYSFLVRVLELQTPVGPAELPFAKQLTDRIVLADKSLTMLQQQQVTLAGLPGYYYLYTFTDPTTGQVGAHSHFFVFKGKEVISLVFQAIPSDQFRGAANIFDQITMSLRLI